MNLIFDFNGTISDSLDTSVEILNNFLKKKKVLITKEEIRLFGLKYLAKKNNLSNLSIYILLLRSRIEISRYMNKLSIFPKMAGVIKELSKNNTLGIISSNSKDNIKVFLDKYGLLNYFSFICDETNWFGKDKKIIKILREKNLNKFETFYIGDEGRDIEAAKKAGVKSVAVTWGFDSKENLKLLKPDFIVNTPIELLSLK